VNDDLWQRISDFRADELAEVRSDLDVFVDLMRYPDRNCVTRTTFELIEPQSFAPPCGRCPSCRKASIEPPHLLHAAGLEKIWTSQAPVRGSLPRDTLIVAPADPHFDAGLPKLVANLTSAGVDQIVVPFGLAERVAKLMVASPTRLGFVLDEREWTGGNRLVDVATAVLLPDSSVGAEAFMDRVELFRRDHDAPLLVVARPDRIVRGRRIDQSISRYAPYAQGMLALDAEDTAGPA
jgi:ATP-dependent DNA helicase RecQ